MSEQQTVIELSKKVEELSNMIAKLVPIASPQVEPIVEKEDSIQIRATINDFTEKIDSQKEYKIYIDDIITDEDNNKIYLVKKIEEIN